MTKKIDCKLVCLGFSLYFFFFFFLCKLKMSREKTVWPAGLKTRKNWGVTYGELLLLLFIFPYCVFDPFFVSDGSGSVQ